MNSDPLIAGESQPFATAAAIVRADERLTLELSNIRTPALIIHGTADNAAKTSGSQHLYERAGAEDKTLKLYGGRYHDPLNDIGKEDLKRGAHNSATHLLTRPSFRVPRQRRIEKCDQPYGVWAPAPPNQPPSRRLAPMFVSVF